MTTEAPNDLVEHLVRMTGLSREQSARVVREVTDYFSENLDHYVIRRHRELQLAGNSNPVIFSQIIDEVSRLRFPASALNERKVRRIIYG